MKTDFAGVIAAKGITPQVLACQLKRELRAKETKFIKIKAFPKPKQQEGCEPNEVIQSAMPRGKRSPYRMVYEGGVFEDTVIAVDVINWSIRQNARMDAQKLLNAYPSEKVDHKHGGTIFVNTGIQRPMDAGQPSGEPKIAVPGESSQAVSEAKAEK